MSSATALIVAVALVLMFSLGARWVRFSRALAELRKTIAAIPVLRRLTVVEGGRALLALVGLLLIGWVTLRGGGS